MSPLILGMWVFIGLLGIIASVLSASETAITAASKVRLYRRAQAGQVWASLVLELQKKMGQIISSILLANTWIMTLMTALTTRIFVDVFGAQGVFYATCVMSLLLTIYVEVMPKVFVYKNPENMAILLAPVINGVRKILTPVSVCVDVIAKKSLQWSGLGMIHTKQSNESLEDLKGAIDLYQGGYAAAQARTMLRSVLSLNHVRLTSVMVEACDMFSLSIDQPKIQLIQKVLEQNFTRIPIWEGDPSRIIGILNVRNLLPELKAHHGHWENTDLRKILTPPIFVHEETTLFSQLEGFRFGASHLVLVKDKNEKLRGMITLEDIVENIVGDILEEHEFPHQNGTLSQKSTTQLFDLQGTLGPMAKVFGLGLQESSDTFEDYIRKTLGYIPQDGEDFCIQGWYAQILLVRGQRKVALSVHPSKPSHGFQDSP